MLSLYHFPAAHGSSVLLRGWTVSTSTSDRKRHRDEATWLLATPLAILSTWFIIMERNYHHALHLGFIHMLAALIFSGLRRSVGTWSETRKKLIDTGPLERPRNIPTLPFLLGATTLGMSMATFGGAIAYCQNLPPLIMLSLWTFLCERIGLFIIYRKSKPSVDTVIRLCIAIAAVAYLTYDDYRLDIVCAVFGFLSATLSGATRVLLDITYQSSKRTSIPVLLDEDLDEDTLPEEASDGECEGRKSQDIETLSIQSPKIMSGDALRIQLWDSQIEMSIPLSLGIYFVWILIRKDRMQGLVNLQGVNPFVLGFNTLCVVTAFFSGGSLPAFIAPSPKHLDSDGENSSVKSTQLVLTAIIGVFSMTFCYYSYTSPTSFFAYIAGVLALVDPKQWNILFRGTRSIGQTFGQIDRLVEETVTARLLKTRVTKTILLAAFTSWSVLTMCSLIYSPRHIEKPSARLDTSYIPSADLDVVVSMYQEPIADIMEIFNEISRSSVGFTRVEPRLWIYTKDPKANLTAIKEATNAHQIITLPNIGREGQTYLHHILSNWDDLAWHTLFMQAEVHFKKDFLQRLRFYYSANTGMLTFGKSGYTCDCNSCGDRDWTDGNNTISKTYETVYGATCKRALLSYRGQFLASAQRIRGASRLVYQQLNDALLDPSGWIHQQPFLDSMMSWKKDSLDAPWFGFTIERMWSVLMQCSDPYVAWACPSLESGVSMWSRKRDCQCFDDVWSHRDSIVRRRPLFPAKVDR